MSSAPVFSAHNLSARRGWRHVFRQVAFSLQAGDALLVTGANGSGKSSLLRVLAGLLDAQAGDIFWRGAAVRNDSDAYRRALCYIGHLDAVKPELTVSEQIAYWQALDPDCHHHTAHDSLKVFELSSLRDRPVRALSAGQKRRLSLTRLVMKSAPIWLLDEPLTALDQAGQQILQQLIRTHRAKDGIVILATHQPIALENPQLLDMDAARAMMTLSEALT